MADNTYFIQTMSSGDLDLLKKFSTIYEFMEYTGRVFGDKNAILENVDEQTRHITYRELAGDSFRIGTNLGKKLEKHATVVLLGNTEAMWLKSFIGLTSCGVKVALLPPSLPKEAICSIMASLHASGIVFGKEFEVVAKTISEELGLKVSVCFEDLYLFPDDPKQTCDSHNISDDDLCPANISSGFDIQSDDVAAFFFTSGTTGKNKIVPLTHKVIMQNAYNGMLGTPSIRNARILAVLPLFHVFGLIRSVLTILNQGGEVYLNRSIKTLLPDLKRAKPTIMVMVPTMAEMLYKFAEKNGTDVLGGRLKTIITGGAPMRPVLKENYLKHDIHVLQGFGMTECPMVFGNPEKTERSLFGSVGKIFEGTEMKIVEDEILVRGDGVFGGYLNPLDNAQAFNDGWFKTGDLAKVDENGFVFITGRRKFLIVTDEGENVSPEELEMLVLNLPEVEECVAYQCQSPAAPDKRTIGIDIFSQSVSEEEMKLKIQTINRTLPFHKQMQVVHMREKPFEKNAANKVIREGIGY